jgi:D-glycero-D-manno-heptose 1,7-bisphosphate phosphatase
LSGSPVVFLDRDGTINLKAPDGEYVTTPDQFELLPGAAEAIRRLNLAGLPVVVVTNQRGIALGRMTGSDLAGVHDRLRRDLGVHGARIDAIYHCPHDRGRCGCRKPASGMLLHAAEELGIDLTRSVIVGDSLSDIDAGARVGVRGILLDPRGDCSPAGRFGSEPDFEVSTSLAAAVDGLLAARALRPVG